MGNRANNIVQDVLSNISINNMFQKLINLQSQTKTAIAGLEDTDFIQKKTAAEWTSQNPVLPQGTTGLETDTNKRKIGNGTSNWNTLVYEDMGAKTNVATAITDIADADLIGVTQSSIWKKITWASFKTVLGGTFAKLSGGNAFSGLQKIQYQEQIANYSGELDSGKVRNYTENTLSNGAIYDVVKTANASPYIATWFLNVKNYVWGFFGEFSYIFRNATDGFNVLELDMNNNKVKASSLAGTGTRVVTASSTGELGTTGFILDTINSSVINVGTTWTITNVGEKAGLFMVTWYINDDNYYSDGCVLYQNYSNNAVITVLRENTNVFWKGTGSLFITGGSFGSIIFNNTTDANGGMNILSNTLRVKIQKLA